MSVNQKISLIGLGKLGLSLACVMAKSGRSVLGVDIIEEVVQKVNHGDPPMFEPGLKELLMEVSGKTLEATTEIERAVNETDCSFILVQTPSLETGRYSNEALFSVLTGMCAEIKRTGKKGHVIVVCSTVQPGTLKDHIKPFVEKHTGMTVGQDVFLAYNPELVALGTTIKNFSNPDFVLIGADDDVTADNIRAVQNSMTNNSPPFHVMSIESAELVKLTLNMYLTVKISYANLVSQLVADMPGVNIDDVMSAVGSDSRIGSKFIKAGPSFGGTCFPRDVRAFKIFAEDRGKDADFPISIDHINKGQDDLLAHQAISLANNNNLSNIVIVGAAFKSSTPILVESAAIKLAHRLQDEGYSVTFVDDNVTDVICPITGTRFQKAQSIADAMLAPSLVIMHHGDKNYQEALLEKADDSHIILDCWGGMIGTDISTAIYRLGRLERTN